LKLSTKNTGEWNSGYNSGYNSCFNNQWIKDSTSLKVNMKYTHKSLKIAVQHLWNTWWSTSFFVCFSEDVQTNLKSLMVNLEFKVSQPTELCCDLTGRHRVMIVRKTLQRAKLFILMCIFVVVFLIIVLCIFVHYWGLLGIFVDCGLFIKEPLCELMWLNCNNF
jgi:hypothetical protein